MITEAEVREALGEVLEPKSGMNLISLGLVESIDIEGANVKIRLGINFDFSLTPATIYIINSIKKKLHSIGDIDQVEVELLSKTWEHQVV